jgi:hypothetical protein
MCNRRIALKNLILNFENDATFFTWSSRKLLPSRIDYLSKNMVFNKFSANKAK